MPALPDVPSVVRVRMIGLLGTDNDVVNVFHVKYSGTAGSLTNSDATSLASGIATEWNSHMAALVTAGYALTGVTVEDLTSTTGAIGQWTGSHAGTDSGTTASAGTALVIKELVYRRFRGGHYRQYIAGCSNAHLSVAQVWDTGFTTTAVTDYTAFRAGISSHFPSGLQPSSDVGVSYYEGFTNVDGPTGRARPRSNLRGTPVVDQIYGFAANPNAGSQRRRNKQSL